MGVRLPLKVVTTCSTVAELPAGDVDLSKYLTKSEAEYTYAKSEDVDARFTNVETSVMAAGDKADAALSDVKEAAEVANVAVELATQANINIGKMNDDSNVVVFSGTYEDGSEFSFKVPGAVTV